MPAGCAQSGDGPVIPLVEADKLPKETKDRYKVVQKMSMITEYAFAGDYTGMPSFVEIISSVERNHFAVEAIEKAVTEVGKFDAGAPLPSLIRLHAY